MADATFRNPVSAYTSRDRLACEREILFGRHPLLVGLSCQLAHPGDFLTDDGSGTPTLVVRRPDGGLGALVNVCRHRGARVADGCGSGKRAFSCPYHGWTYDLDGRLVDVPGAEGFPDLVRDEHALGRLAVVERYGLVWVRVAPPGEPTIDIDAYLAGLGAELESYAFGDYHHFATRTLAPRINWKMAVDTFLEAYHLDALHHGTVGPIFFSNLCLADAFGLHHRMVAVRRSFAAVRGTPAAERDFLRHTIELYTLFPNAVFVHQADHLEVWRMFPDRERADACTVSLSLYIPEPATSDKARRHWEANLQLALDAVEGEDFRLGEGMQRGFSSGAQAHVTFGRNEPALIHFHRSLRQALGLDDGPGSGR
jgi:phenylpropionate dioxygenase-like ring-hydroxylating dioxygenase large terminal subunit